MDSHSLAVSFADTLLRNEEWTKRFHDSHLLVIQTANTAKMLAAEFEPRIRPGENISLIDDDPETLRVMGKI